jgi:hypothetical protein
MIFFKKFQDTTAESHFSICYNVYKNKNNVDKPKNQNGDLLCEK